MLALIHRHLNTLDTCFHVLAWILVVSTTFYVLTTSRVDPLLWALGR